MSRTLRDDSDPVPPMTKGDAIVVAGFLCLVLALSLAGVLR